MPWLPRDAVHPTILSACPISQHQKLVMKSDFQRTGNRLKLHWPAALALNECSDNVIFCDLVMPGNVKQSHGSIQIRDSLVPQSKFEIFSKNLSIKKNEFFGSVTFVGLKSAPSAPSSSPSLFPSTPLYSPASSRSPAFCSLSSSSSCVSACSLNIPSRCSTLLFWVRFHWVSISWN